MRATYKLDLEQLTICPQNPKNVHPSHKSEDTHFIIASFNGYPAEAYYY